MLAAVGKVFLFDASGLEGLLRIGSFVALGFSLIGIGWLYSRQLASPAAVSDQVPAMEENPNGTERPDQRRAGRPQRSRKDTTRRLLDHAEGHHKGWSLRDQHNDGAEHLKVCSAAVRGKGGQ